MYIEDACAADNFEVAVLLRYSEPACFESVNTKIMEG